MERIKTAVFLLIFGLLFVGSSVYLLLQNKHLMKTGERTTAIVIRTERRHIGGGSLTRTYIPVLEYTIDGVKYEKDHPVGNALPKYEDGTTFEIIYDKDNPKKMLIIGDKTQTVLPIILIAIGLLFLGLAPSQLLS